MSRDWFGTDGVRGIANRKLTPELALSIGQGAGRWLLESQGKPSVVIGGDTRRSTPMIAAALSAGLCSTGIDVYDVGIAPTPAVSFLARTSGYGLGAIVSASHNPAPDNGIKFVGPDGRKLSDADEERIESLMSPLTPRPEGSGVGVIRHGREGIEAYITMLAGLLPERLDGLKIALDAAHGAAYEIGPEVLRRLGAEVVSVGVDPDGMNINAEGGATKPDTIGRLTKGRGAAIGVAFDGDADRAVFSDEKGRLINGDRTMGVWAVHRQNCGELLPPTVVGTVMSNGGFEAHLKQLGIHLERAPVGDKYVAERIRATGASIGGEQSGHIIFPALAPTGDGLITMLELLRVIRVEGHPASSYYDAYEPWPQLLVNVGVARTDGWRDLLSAELEWAESELADCGRVVVRPSGTQPMIRVMVEANEYQLRDAVADRIVDAMIAKLGGEVHGRVDLTYALGD